ncbi:hypothetical protein Tco_0896253 [Tanacetum coccineum]
MEANEANTKVEWDPTNIEFRNWLASKFRNHKIMDRYTKNALWNYWRRGDDEEVIIDDELSNPRDENLMKENEIGVQLSPQNCDDGAQKNKEWFDEHELMEDDNDDIGDLEDYLIQKDPPYYVNEENERSKEIRCNLLGIPYVKPPTCKSKRLR